MLFNSIEFLLFLPVVFALYWACRGVRWQNAFTVVASYFFYGCWDWRFLGLIAVTTLCSYAGGLAVERWRDSRGSRVAVAASVVINLGILVVFKYYNFFAGSLVDLLALFGWHADWATLNVVLPVGISFYTFQAIGYSVDVYRGTIKAERNWVSFFAFISFFPQLVAGPIERAGNLLPQFGKRRSFSYDLAADGMRQMLWGFFKKLVVADKCATTVDMYFSNYGHYDGPTLAFGVALFAIQIYADFSGYSDIAIGVAKLFGIRLTRNFNNPFFAVSMSDFWQRWHISLMSWLRDYVYIPLGGGRRGRVRKVLNVWAVFLLSGLWHGANWTYVAWGGYNALLMTPRALAGKRSKTAEEMGYIERILRRIVVFLLFLVGVAVFRSATITDAVNYLWRIFSLADGRNRINDMVILAYIAVMLAAEWLLRRQEHGLQIGGGVIAHRWIRRAIYFLLIMAIFWHGQHASQFIYFQF